MMEFGRFPESLGARHPASLLATWFGAGLLPYAPGSWGSLAALPFGFVISLWFGPIGLFVAALALFLAGWWAAEVYEEASGDKDPGAVVIDEVVGQFLVLIATPPEFAAYVLAFLIFRVLDITKPWPADWVEKNVKGGLGIMLDDVVAGAYGAFWLFLIFTVLNAARTLI